MSRIVVCRKCRKIAIVLTGVHHFVTYSWSGIELGIEQAFEKGHISMRTYSALARSIRSLRGKFPQSGPKDISRFSRLHSDIRDQLSQKERNLLLPGVLIAEDCCGKLRAVFPS